jgi:hypothetical protein
MRSKLSVASVRPARTKEDIERATEFLGTGRVREIMEGHPEERGCVRLCEAEGEIVGALLIDPTPILLRDTEVRCARLTDLGQGDGRRRFRDTGATDLFEFLIEEFLGYVWARRYPVAYVHGEQALYPAHDFTPCFFHARTRIDVRAALTLHAPYRVRHFKSDDVAAVHALRRTHRRQKPVVLASGVPLFHHFSIEAPNREVKGYFSLEINPKAAWNPRFFSPEADVADRHAASTLLRHCAEKAAEQCIDEMHFPLGPAHPVSKLCIEHGGESVVRGPSVDARQSEEMLHVPDAGRFVTELKPYLERRLAAARARKLKTRIPIETERGAWALEVENGTVSMETVDASLEVPVRVPSWRFTQMLSGFRGGDELGVELFPEQHEVLSMLFPKTWPYSMPDPDHWASRKHPRPFSRAAWRHVSQVELPWATW